MFTEGRRIIREYDEKMMKSGDFSLKNEANEALCRMEKERTVDTLNKVLQDASVHMKNGYNRADN
jgi:dipeptidase